MTTTQATRHEPEVTAAGLVERARELTPVVRERALRAEELRRLPQETIRDFVDAGFVRACVPQRFGGMGFEADVAADIALEVARGCGASGWLASFSRAVRSCSDTFRSRPRPRCGRRWNRMTGRPSC